MFHPAELMALLRHKILMRCLITLLFFSTAELWLNIAHLTRSHFTGCVFTPALISLFKTPRHLITFFFFLPRHLISVTFLLCLHKQEIDYIKPKRTRAASADEYGGDINVNTSKYGRLK